MPRRKATPTVAELMTTINILQKKIERKERQIIKPFTSIILKAEKTGRLDELHEACRSVVYGVGQTERAEVKTTADVKKANIIEAVAETLFFLKTLGKFSHLTG